MVTLELISEMKNAEYSLASIDPNLPLQEFMLEFEQIEEVIDALRERGCNAIYEQTKTINSKATIFQVYRHTLRSSDLESFFRMMNDEE